MVTSVKQMLETANAAVPKITPDQASDMIKKGNTLSHAECWNFAPTRTLHTTTRISIRKDRYPLLRFRRSFCARREGPQGYGLRQGL
jgi:hypothetical protein